MIIKRNSFSRPQTSENLKLWSKSRKLHICTEFCVPLQGHPVLRTNELHASRLALSISILATGDMDGICTGSSLGYEGTTYVFILTERGSAQDWACDPVITTQKPQALQKRRVSSSGPRSWLQLEQELRRAQTGQADRSFLTFRLHETSSEITEVFFQ